MKFGLRLHLDVSILLPSFFFFIVTREKCTLNSLFWKIVSIIVEENISFLLKIGRFLLSHWTYNVVLEWRLLTAMLSFAPRQTPSQRHSTPHNVASFNTPYHILSMPFHATQPGFLFGATSIPPSTPFCARRHSFLSRTMSYSLSAILCYTMSNPLSTPFHDKRHSRYTLIRIK